MRILIYSKAFYPSIGGIERVTFELASGLAGWAADGSNEEMFDVTVVTRTAAGINQDAKLPFRVVRQPSFRKLLTLVHETEMLHLAGPSMLPLALGLAMGKPVAIEHHGFQVVCPNGQLFHVPQRKFCEGHYMAGRYDKCLQCNLAEAGLVRSTRMLFLTPFRRWLSNRATMNIAPTAWLGSVVMLRHVKAIYHGLSLECYDQPECSTLPTFAFQGRLVSTKGAEVLLEAAKQIRAEGLNFLIKIIGDGPERHRLERQAESLGDSVQFLGHVPDDQLADAYSDVTAVVVPSLAGEVFGLVAAENMLRGKILIVSNIGSLEEVIGTTGMIAPAGNTTALASCMRRVIEDPAQTLPLGAAARARAIQVFGTRRMIQAHISVYRQATQ